jgi:hypothetical protein
MEETQKREMDEVCGFVETSGDIKKSQKVFLTTSIHSDVMTT